MALGKLENTFGNWHRKLDLLETEMRNIEKWSWIHWKIELEILENGIRNIGKMELGTLENEI